MDLNTAPGPVFAEFVKWAVLTGYHDAETGADGATPSQILERAECSGSLDHEKALFDAYLLGRKHFDWTTHRAHVERAPPSQAGRPVQQHTMSLQTQRPVPHLEIYPRSPATARPAMSVPMNPSVQKASPPQHVNLKSPWSR